MGRLVKAISNREVLIGVIVPSSPAAIGATGNYFSSRPFMNYYFIFK
jgi:hypothetical protein